MEINIIITHGKLLHIAKYISRHSSHLRILRYCVRCLLLLRWENWLLGNFIVSATATVMGCGWWKSLSSQHTAHYWKRINHEKGSCELSVYLHIYCTWNHGRTLLCSLNLVQGFMGLIWHRRIFPALGWTACRLKSWGERSQGDEKI